MLPYIRPYAEERYITKALGVHLVLNLKTQQIKWEWERKIFRKIHESTYENECRTIKINS
jgi:hypothetical protein